MSGLADALEAIAERGKRDKQDGRATMVVYVGCAEEAEWLNVSLNNGAEIVGRHVLDNAVVYELSGSYEINPSQVPLAEQP